MTQPRQLIKKLRKIGQFVDVSYVQGISTNMCKGYKVGSEEVEVSLLQFVDGTLFFEEVSSHDILVVKSILRNFELMSELKVNYHKSKVVGILVDHRRTQGLADILNCKTMNIPFIYLRIPVGANLKKEATWESVINKMKRRL